MVPRCPSNAADHFPGQRVSQHEKDHAAVHFHSMAQSSVTSVGSWNVLERDLVVLIQTRARV